MKLGRKQYIMLVAETLTDSYGSTLIEGDTDIVMAKAVIRKLKKYLCFRSSDVTNKQFKEWRDEVKERAGIYEEDED